jgi:preprotein translocase subunit SecG
LGLIVVVVVIVIVIVIVIVLLATKHKDPLLGNDRERRNCTAAIAK